MDFDDYCKKDPAFITMSVYMINLLRTKDSNSLFHSILYGHLRNKPSFLPGAPGCLDFESKTGSRVAICLAGGKDEAQEVLNAFEKFKSCKDGPIGPARNSTDSCTKEDKDKPIVNIYLVYLIFIRTPRFLDKLIWITII